MIVRIAIEGAAVGMSGLTEAEAVRRLRALLRILELHGVFFFSTGGANEFTQKALLSAVENLVGPERKQMWQQFLARHLARDKSRSRTFEPCENASVQEMIGTALEVVDVGCLRFETSVELSKANWVAQGPGSKAEIVTLEGLQFAAAIDKCVEAETIPLKRNFSTEDYFDQRVRPFAEFCKKAVVVDRYLLSLAEPNARSRGPEQRRDKALARLVGALDAQGERRRLQLCISMERGKTSSLGRTPEQRAIDEQARKAADREVRSSQIARVERVLGDCAMKGNLAHCELYIAPNGAFRDDAHDRVAMFDGVAVSIGNGLSVLDGEFVEQPYECITRLVLDQDRDRATRLRARSYATSWQFVEGGWRRLLHDHFVGNRQ